MADSFAVAVKLNEPQLRSSSEVMFTNSLLVKANNVPVCGFISWSTGAEVLSKDHWNMDDRWASSALLVKQSPTSEIKWTGAGGWFKEALPPRIFTAEITDSESSFSFMATVKASMHCLIYWIAVVWPWSRPHLLKMAHFNLCTLHLCHLSSTCCFSRVFLSSFFSTTLCQTSTQEIRVRVQNPALPNASGLDQTLFQEEEDVSFNNTINGGKRH